jgi:putative ABC transport system substrate-binding protein
MKRKLRRFLLAAFLALVAVLTARAEPMTPWQQAQDERLVREERELSRLRSENPGDVGIARRHDEASRAALDRARERVGLIRTSTTARSMPRIGYVASTAGPTFDAFRQGMRDAGYVEGRDFSLEARFTEGRQERFPAMVDELLRRGVEVLLAGSPTGAIAALKADTSTPIVIAGVTDPHGLAGALGRPSKHVTGTSVASREAGARWVEMLKQVCPGMTQAAVLANPAHRSRDRWVGDIREAALRLGVRIDVHDAGDSAGLEEALAAIAASDAQGLIVTGEPVFLVDRAKIIAFAERRRIPAVYFSKLFADSGGLLAYGGSLEDSYRMSSRYIDRILKGAKPSDLPVEDTRVELVVNKRSAQALGIALPEDLLRRADKVIE